MPYLHSHMLGVLSPYRDLGIGRKLKLRQREDALARGIRLIEWTFDPLELKNAFFNIERLGAIVRRYNPNQYGLTASPLHGGLPTDRCYAEWWLDSPRVATILAGGKVDSSPQLRIAYPADIARIRAEDSHRARAIQQRERRKISEGLCGGAGRDALRALGHRRSLPVGAVEMKIERITLRQIRMPLVHFFETSFGRTYERDIILVEVQGEGASGWGEVTAGENPFYNEEWTDSAWLILRDYAAPRVLGPRSRQRRRRVSADRAHPRPQHGARRPGDGHLGPGSAPGGRAAVAEDRRRRAPRNSLRRLHRHSGFGGAVARKDRTRTGRRLPAHQDEDQAGLGCRRGAPGARALSRHQADGRRQFRLHAGRRGPSEASSTIST